MLGDIERSWEENGKQVFQIKKEGEREMEGGRQWGEGRKGKGQEEKKES